jgi:aromatic-L-amino-acid decarboxylase
MYTPPLFDIHVDVVAEHPYLKVHVDAAWAGVVLACPEFRDLCFLDEVNDFADSFCTNFHKVSNSGSQRHHSVSHSSFKWGLVNFDASTLWVRDRKYLTKALDFTPVFLKTVNMDSGILFTRLPIACLSVDLQVNLVDFRNWHLGLGRRFRSLKVC